jgi:predicted acylesterase/phospholipase RssA
MEYTSTVFADPSRDGRPSDTPFVNRPMTQRMQARRPSGGATAFILQGGGAYGALQVGAIKALLESGVRPDVIVGTSIGALNGALLASDPTLAGVESSIAVWRSAHAVQTLLGDETVDLAGASTAGPIQSVRERSALILTALHRLLKGESSLFANEGPQRLINRLLRDQSFEDLAVPLRVIATEIHHNRRVIFASGSLAPAIMASFALPGLLPPVRIGEDLYEDGAVLDSYNLDVAIAFGARRLFIVLLNDDRTSATLDLRHDEVRGEHAQQMKASALATDGIPDEHNAGAPAHPVAMTAAMDAVAPRMPLSPARIRIPLHFSVPPIAATLLDTLGARSAYQLTQEIQSLPQDIEAHVLALSPGDGSGLLNFSHTGLWIERGYALTRDQIMLAPEISAPMERESAP